MIVDHLVATTLMGAVILPSIARYNPVTAMAQGAILGFSFGSMGWWMYNIGMPGHSKAKPNIIYEDDCTPEEIERFTAMDTQEAVAFNMRTMPCFGQAVRDPRGIM